jgi:hypothetical protein
LLETEKGDDDGRGADRVAHAAAISRADGKTLPYLKRVLIGGSACPRAMIEASSEIRSRSRACLGHDGDEPAGHAGHAQGGLADELPYEEQLAYKLKQGHPPFGVEMKIVDDEERNCRATARRSAG